MVEIERKLGLPNLSEMLAAGIGITDALAFWNEMMNSPPQEPGFWWAEMKRRSATSEPADPVLH
jgi:hypothetical protein